MHVMFLVAAKIHFGWQGGNHLLGAAKIMLIFNFILIYNVHLLLRIPWIETVTFSLLCLFCACCWMMWRLYLLIGMQKFQANSTLELFSFEAAVLGTVELLSVSKSFDARWYLWRKTCRLDFCCDSQETIFWVTFISPPVRVLNVEQSESLRGCPSELDVLFRHQKCPRGTLSHSAFRRQCQSLEGALSNECRGTCCDA